MECKTVEGVMNVPMRTVYSGQKEGFASHKKASLSEGVKVQCKYHLQGQKEKYIHIMYHMYPDLSTGSNSLALSVCDNTKNRRCRFLTANQMEYNEYEYVSQNCYGDVIKDTVICDEDLCVVGSMGNDHKTEISIKVYPANYDDLNERIQQAKDLHSKSYENLIREKKHYWRNTPPQDCRKAIPSPIPPPPTPTWVIVIAVLGSLFMLCCCCSFCYHFCKGLKYGFANFSSLLEGYESQP